ncbi:MAG TPA: hypothetical protein PKC20_02635 [Burkholderiaceae bacterium]|nr:hypothetical protein [Burkholderiaceae bacterium]
MTKLANGARHLSACATTLGVGGHALRVTRQLAGARKRLTDKALFRFDVELSGFSRAADPDPWRADAPLPELVLRHARDFMRVLPGSLPEPLVFRDEDGALAFEWAGENARSLKVKVGADGMLVYSGRLGLRRRISGAEPLGDDLPAMIRQAIQQVAG